MSNNTNSKNKLYKQHKLSVNKLVGVNIDSIEIGSPHLVDISVRANIFVRVEGGFIPKIRPLYFLRF